LELASLNYLPDWPARYPVPTAPISFVPELGTDEVLSMFTPKDRLKGLAPEDRLEGLASEEIETYLKKLRMKTVH